MDNVRQSRTEANSAVLPEISAVPDFYRVLVTECTDPVIVVDSDGIVRFFNPAAETLFGIPAPDILGMPFGFPAIDDAAQEISIHRNDGETRIAEMRTVGVSFLDEYLHVVNLRDVTIRKQLMQSLEESNRQLERALEEVKELQGYLPICVYCKKIRDDTDYWQQMEKYIQDRSNAQFTHGICPTCYDEQVSPQLDA